MVSTSWSRFPLKLICCVGFGSTSRVFCSLKSIQKKPPEVFLKTSQSSHEKNLCQSLFFNKKETLAQVFSCEFCDIFKNTFLQNNSGRLLLSIAIIYYCFLRYNRDLPKQFWCSLDCTKNLIF